MFRTHMDVTRFSVPINENKDSDDVPDQRYKCDLCPDSEEGWASETEVMLHTAYVHTKYIDDLLKNNELICKICMASFVDEDSVICHIKSEHLLSSSHALRVERRVYACDACGALFFNKLMLTHHVKYKHTGRRKVKKDDTFKCPTCLRFVRYGTSWYHFRAHKLQSIMCCKICCKKFKDRASLRAHLRTHPPVYSCEMCGYDTKKEHLFTFHIDSAHGDGSAEPSDTDADADADRLFLMPEAANKWRKLNLMGWRGLRLTNGVSVCVLCRAICRDAAGRRRHARAHSLSERAPARSAHACPCGLLFPSALLLRHHWLKFGHMHD